MRPTSSGLVFWVVLCLAGPAPAQDETEDIEMEMFFSPEETVTSAARHEQDIGMSPSAVTVLNREDIRTSGAINLVDLFRMVPGLDVIVNSPAFTSVSGRLNWTLENNHCLVLIDGREANIELLGSTVFENLSITLEDIDRIEVIRGPGSSLYGANALSCVITISTLPISDEPTAHLAMGGGEVASLSFNARASARVGDFGFAVNGGVSQMGTFADQLDRGREVWRAHATTEYRLGEKQRLLLDGGYSRGEGWMALALSGMKGGIEQGSVRLAYESETLRGQLFWNRGIFTADFSNDLEFSGIRLATLLPVEVTGDVLDAEVGWTLPTFWDPLLIMVGANGRFSRVESDDLLDGEKFTDPGSDQYHQPGLEHMEGRGGAFVHLELAPFDWMTVTGGLRFDYNTVTDEFLSPRVAAVFRPAQGHFLRIGIARSFRKPAFFETGTHLMVGFPEDSPITGTDQVHFQEFMSGVLGNADLKNEELIAYEAGYLGRFLEGNLTFSLDLYYNEYKNEVVVFSDVTSDERGMPDLEATVLRNINLDEPLKVAGCELTVRYSPVQWLSLLATWTWREPTNRTVDASPKHLFAVGGRFHTDWGLIGSLYAFTRSEFWDRYLPNPKGLFEDFEIDHLETAVLFLGRLGWRWSTAEILELEVGLKMFFPFAPWSDSLWRYRELGGGITAAGENFGGDLLRRVVLGYLEGSF